MNSWLGESAILPSLAVPLSMTLARNILHWLDRPSCRGLLARYATWHASRVTSTPIEVFYDGVWMHRIGTRYWADGETFRYSRWLPTKWRRVAAAHDEMVRRNWCYVYCPKPGDVIVDVGAGDGSDLPVFSEAVGPTGQVLAIEAHPTTFLLLEKAVHWNRLGNVTCVHAAVAEDEGILRISDSDRHIANAIVNAPGESGATTLEVAARSLDAICSAAGIEQIDFLKMNIEGAEQYAIRGLTALLSRTKHFCIACHDFRADRGDGESFRTRAAVMAFLRDQKFQIICRDEHPDPCVRDHVHAVNLDCFGAMESAHTNSQSDRSEYGCQA